MTTATGTQLTGISDPFVHSSLTNGTTLINVHVLTAMNGAGAAPRINLETAIENLQIRSKPMTR